MVVMLQSAVGNTAQSKTAGTTLSVGTISSAFAGDIIVITTSYDNTTATAPTVTASHTGTASVTWTTQVTSNSPTATSGGGVRTAIITGVITADGSVTMTLTYSASITAKIADYRIFRYGNTTTPAAGGAGASGTSTTITVTTAASASIGDIVVGVAALEGTAVPPDDTDTTNGFWTTGRAIATSGGSGTTNISQKTQHKIQTTASSTQTYNRTITSADWSTSVLIIKQGTINPPTSLAVNNVRGGVELNWVAPASGLYASRYSVYAGGVLQGYVLGIVSGSNNYFIPRVTSWSGTGTINTASVTYTVRSIAGEGSESADSTGVASVATDAKIIKPTSQVGTSNLDSAVYTTDINDLADGSDSSYMTLDITSAGSAGYVDLALPDLELDANSRVYLKAGRNSTVDDSWTVTGELRDSGGTVICAATTYLLSSGNTSASFTRASTAPTTGIYSGAYLRVYALQTTSTTTRIYEAVVMAKPVVTTLVNKDLQLIWNDRAVVNQSRQLIWNARAKVSDDLQLIWNSKDTVLVNKNLQLVWNQRALVADNFQAIWNDRAVVNQSRQLIWNQRAVVNQTRQLIWHQRALVNQSRQVIWNMRSLVNATEQFIWNVAELAGTTPVNKDLQLIWSMNQLVNSTEQLIWNQRAVVNSTDQLLWNTRAVVNQSRQLVWRQLQLVSTTEQFIWNQRAVVNQTRQLLWNDRAVTNQSRQLIWHQRALVNQSRQLIWNNLTKVNDDLQLVWNMRQTTGQDRQFIWNMLALGVPVGRELQLVWNDRAVTLKNIQLVWNDRATVQSNEQLIWNVNTRINKSLQTIWNNKALIGKTFQTIWNDRAATGQEVTLTWHVEVNFVWVEVTVTPGTWPPNLIGSPSWVEATVNAGSWSNNPVGLDGWVEVIVDPGTWN